MSALISIWVASLIGAVLFFASGFFLSRAREGKRSQSTGLAQQANAHERERALQLEAELAEVQRRCQHEQQRTVQLSEQLRAGQAQGEALATAQAQRRQLDDELASLQLQLSSVEPLRRELALLKHQAATYARTRTEAEQRLESCTRELTDMKRQFESASRQCTEWKTKAQGLTTDLSTARKSAERASAELTAHEEAAGALRKQLETSKNEQRELKVKNEFLTKRVGELQAYADENTTLREEREF
jgi:chromosome segregation ATPase